MWGITLAWMTVAFNGRRAWARHSRDTGLRGQLLNAGWGRERMGHGPWAQHVEGARRVQKGRLAAGMRGGSTHAGSWNLVILP